MWQLQQTGLQRGTATEIVAGGGIQWWVPNGLRHALRKH